MPRARVDRGRMLRAWLLPLLLVLLASAVAAGPATGTCGGGPCSPGDYDGDGVKDWADNCPLNGNAKQTDNDADTPPPVGADAGTPPSPVGDLTGPVRLYPSTPYQTGQQAPTDRDPLTGGDPCDADDDNDGVRDRRTPGHKGPDNCRRIAHADQADGDLDGLGDVCDDKFDAPVTTTPAAVTLRRPRRLRLDQVRIGVPIRLRCSATCRVRAQATLDRRLARRARGAAAKPLGTGAAELEGQGETYLVLRLDRAALRRLASRLPRVRLIVRVSGGARTASVPLTVTR